MKLLAATVISLSLRGGLGGFESRIDPHRASRLAAPAEGTGRIPFTGSVRIDLISPSPRI